MVGPVPSAAGGKIVIGNYPKTYKIKVCSETGELGNLNYETKTDIISVISFYRMQQQYIATPRNRNKTS